MKFTLIAIVVLFATTAKSQSQTTSVRVKDFMSADEVKTTGIDKLSTVELAALDLWFSRMSTRIYQLGSGNAGSVATPITLPRPSSTSGTASAVSFSSLEGATILADDGEFIGKITTNSYDSQSILNEFGRFGGKFSSTSIFNDFGRYGGEFSRMSPFNQTTSTPPRIFKGERFVGYLTRNESKTPRVDPFALVAWLKSQ